MISLFAQQKKLLCLILISCLSSLYSEAQEYKRILLTNGFLHVGNGQTQASALIGIENGKISLIRNSLAYSYDKSAWDTIIDLKGQHIYPGFVAPNSTLGLTEIEAVKASNDFQEIGGINPHIRSLTAYNTESEVIATVRSNGILITQSTPRGGLISGSSSVMQLAGWNWEDAALLADDGIHLNWPGSIQYEKEGQSIIKREELYEERKREIYRFFQLAKTYALSETHITNDLRCEAMKACFLQNKRVYIHANELQQLLDIIDFAKSLELKYPVIVGGYDSHLITQQLRDAQIPVMLNRLHSLPENEEDAVDLPYRLPALLEAGKVKYCLQNEGDMEAMNARNIPFLAGTAKAYGLSEEQAIRAVSLSSCEIMGIGERYGSIEEGKMATLFVSKGNALDMRTHQVSLLISNGVILPINNKQTVLYKKYAKKYGK